MYDFKSVRDHIEVYLDGEFQFSADNMSEAKNELRCGYGKERVD